MRSADRIETFFELHPTVEDWRTYFLWLDPDGLGSQKNEQSYLDLSKRIIEKKLSLKNEWTLNPDLRFPQLLVMTGDLRHTGGFWIHKEEDFPEMGYFQYLKTLKK